MGPMEKILTLTAAPEQPGNFCACHKIQFANFVNPVTK
jgi:hypothetical protein